MKPFLDAVRAALVAETGLDAAELRLETPKDSSLGDIAFPCFPLAKALRNAPPKIAAELEGKLAARLEGITPKAAGPYLNFTVERELLARTILGEIEERGERYGCSDLGAGKKIVVDLSSPNIAKPMSVGHLRSTVIGAAVQRLHDALGYETVGINHIGDWGSQFGKLVAAVDRWGGDVDLESDPIKGLLALYVRYHEEEEADPSLDEAARAAFRELESGEEGHVRATWRRLTELSMSEFDKIYARLGVTFDEVRGESYYETHLAQTIDRIVEAGITEESEGALIVRVDELEKDCPPSLLRKTDGTTLYATRDLAAAFHRWELYQFERLPVRGRRRPAPALPPAQVRAAAHGPRLGAAHGAHRLRHAAPARGQDEHAQGPRGLPRGRARPGRRRGQEGHRREELRPGERRRDRRDGRRGGRGLQ